MTTNGDGEIVYGGGEFRDDFSGDFHQRPPATAWGRKAVFACVAAAGIYGAAIGSIVSTTEGAVFSIGMAAAIMAVICLYPGTRFGFLFRFVTRIRFGGLLVSGAVAIAGAVLGGFFGIVAMSPLAAMIGAIGGWFCARALVPPQRGFLRRMGAGPAGIFLGACLSVIVRAIQRDQAEALIGIAWGLGAGVICGAALCLLVLGAVVALLRR